MSGRGSKVHKKRVTRSVRAGVVFPVSRICRYMKQSFLRRRVAIGAPIYLSAVLEYLCAEVMELAGNAAADNKRKVITPRHILLAVASDDELHKLLKRVTISQGGVLPHIPDQLLHKKSLAKKSQPPASPGPSTAAKGLAAKKRKPKPTAVATSSPGKTKRAKPATKVTVLSEKTLFLGQKLTVIQGDLSDMAVDVVVHPTNSSFSLAGQCGSSLRKRGGASLEQAVREVSRSTTMAVSEAALSGSGDTLPCSHVIHVHSPSWSTSGSAVSDLEKAVKNCLSLAEKEKLSTIAFPSIASGSNNFPKQTAAQTILRAIRDYFTSSVSSSISQVYFVLYDMESIGVYTLELSRLDD